MKTSYKNANLRWLWLTIIVIVLDQFTKYLARTHLLFMVPKAIFPGFNLTLEINQGAAFSLLDHAGGWQRWFFSIFAIVVSVLLCRILMRLQKQQRCMAVGISLVLGGALGNLCDRLVYGVVTDFIQLYIKTWSWPVFNLADSAVCIGAFLLAYTIMRR